MEEGLNNILEELEEYWYAAKPKPIVQPESTMIRCPIHGIIKLDWYQKYIIDQPFFQRLRGISQLGFSNLIYPGAIHTRFEHSIGVSHLADLLFNVLKNDLILNDYDIELTESDLIELKIAALFHDVGHLPMSHSSEIIFKRIESESKKIKSIQKTIFNDIKIDVNPHEVLSTWLISTEYINEIIREIERFEGELRSSEINISPENIRNMIVGLPPNNPNKSFLSNILHGEIDVDRMDYLLRDAHHTGVPHGQIDLTYLLSTLCLIPDPRNKENLIIGVMKKGIQSVLALLSSRATMYPTVYQHHTSRIAEEMYIRALSYATINNKFDCLNLLKYTNEQILNYLIKIKGLPADLIGRIIRRDLYKRSCGYSFNSKIIEKEVKKDEYNLKLKIDPMLLKLNPFGRFENILKIESAIAKEIRISEDNTIIFVISKIPNFSNFEKKYNFYIKEQEIEKYYHIKDTSFLIPAIQMENFFNWKLQICCPMKYIKLLQDYLEDNTPFSQLNSDQISKIEYGRRNSTNY